MAGNLKFSSEGLEEEGGAAAAAAAAAEQASKAGAPAADGAA